MSKSTKGVLVVCALAAIAGLLAAVAIALRPEGNFVQWGVRWTAMVGYVAVFLAILSSAYMRELYRVLGRPFLWGHHVLSIASLVLLTLHPVGVAIDAASAAVFVPRFDSWEVFFRLGGRPALYLMWIALVGALLRRSWRKGWRFIHLLNYVAFLLGTVHAVLIGTDLGQPFLRLVSIAMALVVLVVFIRKRLEMRQGSQRS